MSNNDLAQLHVLPKTRESRRDGLLDDELLAKLRTLFEAPRPAPNMPAMMCSKCGDALPWERNPGGPGWRLWCRKCEPEPKENSATA